MDAGRAARAGGDYSALILASRITLPHFLRFIGYELGEIGR
jgi:hypothetical protein